MAPDDRRFSAPAEYSRWLRRAHELFGVDLANPEDTLTLWLGLRVAEFD